MCKKKLFLGVLIMILAISFSFALNDKNSISIFAEEQQITQPVDESNNGSGSTQGEGWYIVGQTANLIAVPDPGSAFNGWYLIDEHGDETKIEGANEEYSFIVESNVQIKAKFTKIKYNVNLSNPSVVNEGFKILSDDFSLEVENNSGSDDKLYYEDNLTITVTSKTPVTERYIYDLLKNDIYLNGKSVDKLSYVDWSIINNSNGFEKFVLTLSITENIEIDVKYDYMHKLTFASGNSNPINVLMNFVTLRNAYGYLEGTTYLVKHNENITINLLQGNRIYTFVSSQMNDLSASIDASQTYTITEDCTYQLTYEKIPYSLSFNSYLRNQYGNYDVLSDKLYNIPNISIVPGEQQEIAYTSGSITIDVDEYLYDTTFKGYEFVGFCVDDYDNIQTASLIVAMDEYNPKDVEVKLLFKYLDYKLDVVFVDNYFEEFTTYEVQLSTEKLNKGTIVTLSASSEQYTVKGWKCNSLDKEYDGLLSTYSFIFEPDNDNVSEHYIVYLDMQYKYYSSKFELLNDNVILNAEYNVIKVNLDDKILVLQDSEGNLNSQTITLNSEDISVNGDTVTINTRVVGNLVIENDEMTYGTMLLKSYSKITEDGMDIYTFKKYSYMADLSIGLVNYLTFDDTTLSVYGNLFDDQGTHADQLLHSYNASITYETFYDRYKLSYPYNDIYLYKNGSDYNYISYRGVNFYYNDATSKFEPNVATINTPDDVNVVITKSSSYTLQINNLISTSVVLYMSKTTSSAYEFISHMSNNATLISFDDGDLHYSAFKGTEERIVVAQYLKLSKQIYLNITNKNAYANQDISFKVGGVSSVGNIITAINGDLIEIYIDTDLIARGYKFDGFKFNLSESYLTRDYILEFIMSPLYETTIDVCFSPIDYVLNINYLDAEGNAITDLSLLKGVFTFSSDEFITSMLNQNLVVYENDTITSVILNLGLNYGFKAVSNTGYYLKNAYIGTEAINISSLCVSNSSTESVTYWTLNDDNFDMIVISNADSENNIQLYIMFDIHTYTVKVYFEISSNKNAITYPEIVANGETYHCENVQEQLANGNWTSKFVSVISNVEYDTRMNISIKNGSLTTGIYLVEWRDKDGKAIGRFLNNVKISDNTFYTCVLEYNRYDAAFKILDIDGNECEFGAGKFSIQNPSYKLLDEVIYTANAYKGYVLDRQYYIDNLGQENEIASGFRFNPSKYQINNMQFYIYLVFDLKHVNINISNSKLSSSSNTLNRDPSEWAELTAYRRRGNETTLLTNDYVFKTGDVLVLDIKPISLGIELYKVRFGSYDITGSYKGAYKFELTRENVYMIEDKDSEIKYQLVIEFENDLMDQLEDEISLDNIFKVKTYNLRYTYNLINKKCKIMLAYNNITLNKIMITSYDTEYVDEIEYGSIIEFKYDQTTMSNRFEQSGFIVNGKVYKPNDTKLRLEDLGMWEQIAIDKYNNGSNELIVSLMLKPHINLQGYDVAHFNQTGEYKYTRIYNAQTYQLEKDVHIFLVEGFTLSVKYNGSSDLPINVGVYNVNIEVSESDGSKLPFEGVVIFEITPKTLTLSTTLTQTKPLPKVYDGNNRVVNLDDLIKAISIQGVCGGDQIRITTNAGLYAVYSSSQVDLKNVYNITIYNLYLEDNSGGTIRANYVLNTGVGNNTSITFERVGKITPKTLRVVGYKINDKVYDGSQDLDVDLTGINYVGVVPTDSANIITENLRFYTEDITVGYKRSVKLDYSKALVGADSTNYKVEDISATVDIHPYELKFNVENYGEFKIMDIDKLCLIPIDCAFKVEVYNSDSYEYKQLYGKIESSIKQGEKFKVAYHFTLKSGVVTIPVPTGLYVSVPSVKKLVEVLEYNEDVSKLDYSTYENNVIVQVNDGDAYICMISNTVYLPLWIILLIVCASAGVISIFIFIFILIRKKTKDKYSAYDKI